MGAYIDWCVDSDGISMEEAKDLSEALGYYLDDDSGWENGCFHVSFYSEGLCDDDDIESILKEFTAKYPALTVCAYLKHDVDECPDMWKFHNGEVRYCTGIVKYYEYDPKTGQTSDTAEGE